jgi:hypothetical protein
VLETTELIGTDYGRVAQNLNTDGAQPGAEIILPQGVMP